MPSILTQKGPKNYSISIHIKKPAEREDAGDWNCATPGVDTRLHPGVDIAIPEVAGPPDVTRPGVL